MGRGSGEKKKWTWMNKAKIRQVEFLATAEACKAIFWPTPGLKEKTFYMHGFSAEGTVLPWSAAPRCGILTKNIPHCLHAFSLGHLTRIAKRPKRVQWLFPLTCCPVSDLKRGMAEGGGGGGGGWEEEIGAGEVRHALVILTKYTF